MSSNLIIIILTLFLTTFILFKTKNKVPKFQRSSIRVFKEKLKHKNRFREKVKTTLSDALMADPKKNIKISAWDQEYILREKADIHRVRLTKYGQSKLNGEMFFKEAGDKVYKYTSDGEKKYI